MYSKIVRITLRKDLKDNWLLNDPVIEDGELVIYSSNGVYSFKIGDGVSKFSVLDSSKNFLSEKEIKEYIASTITSFDKNQEYVINPYNAGGVDVNAHFTCTNVTDNSSELNTFISSLPTNATIRFAKGNYLLGGSSIALNSRKMICDFGSTFTCTSSAVIETPFINVSTGMIEGATFTYNGISTVLSPCIISTGSTIRNCIFNNFAVSAKGNMQMENNTLSSTGDNVYKIVPTGNSFIKNNTFKTINGIIETTGKNVILGNYVQQITLVANTASVSVQNTITVNTDSITGNKVFDFLI